MNAELIFSNCDTNVGSLGIQLPITMRPPGFVTRTISLGDIEGLGCEHGAEHGEGQIKRIVVDAFQIARISFLKLQPVETCLRGAFVPGLHQVPGDIDSHHIGAQTGQRNRRRAVSAAEVQRPQRRRYPEGLDDRFSGLTHESGNLREVAFFPQCFVWIHGGSIWVRACFGRLEAHLVLSRLALIPLQDYNCAVRLLERPCPSVAMTCSNGWRAQIPLRGGQETLQRVRRTEWTHSPKS